MWKVGLWWMLVQSQFGPQVVECGCLCVEGVPRTLCQSVAEAQRQANICPPDFSCPAVQPADKTQAPIYYDAPTDNAHNCRDVRIWDESVAAYTGVKVCDVFTG